MTSPSVEELYAEETARLTAARLPLLTLVFAGVFGVAWGFESLARPERTLAFGLIFGLQVLACLVAVGLTRRESGRRHSVAIAAATCVILCALIGSYSPLVGGEAEIVALGLAYVLTGVAVGIPLAGWGQLPVAIAAVCAYGASVAWGAKSTMSIPITVLGLIAIGGSSVAGAIFFDRYRYASFRRTEELRQANAALAKANAAKNLFLANVSHELRTPLNVILGYAQLMLDESFAPLPPALHQPLERVLASTQTLVYLISDLLDLSRIEAGRLMVQLERVELAPLFAELTAFIAPALVDKPVRVVAEEPHGLAVTADRDRLRQVLVNLLSNAAKFTAQGEIRLRAAAANGRVQISVSDAGIGIAPADLPHIFEPFHRASNAKEFGGVGIGLSISVRLAQAMGGEIAVDSVLGQGSRFTVSLKAAQ